MAWRWTARRSVISAFVIFHLSALMIWTVPNCAIKSQFQSPYRYYMLPLGLWQWWAIFAPDPIRNTTNLNAEIMDAKGCGILTEFPRLGEPSTWWDKIPRYRNRKFTATCPSRNTTSIEFTARHVVRQLGMGPRRSRSGSACITSSRFPLPGTGVADPMASTRVRVWIVFSSDRSRR